MKDLIECLHLVNSYSKFEYLYNYIISDLLLLIICIYIYTRTHTRTYVHTYVYISIYVYIHMYTHIYVCVCIYCIYISQFSHCTKLSQCREQEGSATLVIVTMHLLSTLPIQSERYSSYDILFVTLRYDVGLFCQDLHVPHCKTPHSCSSFSSFSITTIFTFRRTKERFKKENCAM